MPIATTGLILRQIKVGEADRILTILTPDLGVISASAKGSMRLKNKLFSATGLFCYSEFSLTSGRSHYFIDTAQIKNVFHGISATVEGMGLAILYGRDCQPSFRLRRRKSEAQLRLLLNCLYMLSEQKRPVRMLKVIYELRCHDAGRVHARCAGLFRLRQIRWGRVLFGSYRWQFCCVQRVLSKARHLPNLDEGALYALRHICLAEDKKLFSLYAFR